MAISIKKSDIFSGTSLEFDNFHVTGTRGRRRFVLEGGTDSVTDLVTALVFAVNNIDSEFPGSNMPMTRIRLTPLNQCQMICDVHYGFNHFNYSLVAAQSDVAHFNTGFVAVPWFRKAWNGTSNNNFDSLGRPNGNVNTVNNVITKYFWQAPVVTFKVPYYLDFNPISTVASTAQFTNNAPITFGGFAFGQNVVRFDGLSSDWTTRLDNNYYTGYYQFTARPDTWQEEVMTEGDTAPQKADQYKQTNFAGQFPVSI